MSLAKPQEAATREACFSWKAQAASFIFSGSTDMALRPGRPLNPVRSSHSASIYRPALPDAGSLLAGAVFPIARIPIHNRAALGCAPSLPPSAPTHWIPTQTAEVVSTPLNHLPTHSFPRLAEPTQGLLRGRCRGHWRTAVLPICNGSVRPKVRLRPIRIVLRYLHNRR